MNAESDGGGCEGKMCMEEVQNCLSSLLSEECRSN